MNDRKRFKLSRVGEKMSSPVCGSRNIQCGFSRQISVVLITMNEFSLPALFLGLFFPRVANSERQGLDNIPRSLQGASELLFRRPLYVHRAQSPSPREGGQKPRFLLLCTEAQSRGAVSCRSVTVAVGTAGCVGMASSGTGRPGTAPWPYQLGSTRLSK